MLFFLSSLLGVAAGGMTVDLSFLAFAAAASAAVVQASRPVCVDVLAEAGRHQQVSPILLSECIGLAQLVEISSAQLQGRGQPFANSALIRQDRADDVASYEKGNPIFGLLTDGRGRHRGNLTWPKPRAITSEAAKTKSPAAAGLTSAPLISPVRTATG